MAIAATVGSIFIDLYPHVMVSSTNAAYDLTVSNAASGHYALTVMTVVAVIFFPLVLIYQGWSFHVFRGRVQAPPAQPDSGRRASRRPGQIRRRRRCPRLRRPSWRERRLRAHRVVIVGGGFGGLFAAKFLRRAPVEITLIDRTNHHTFQPLLYQLATGILSEGAVAPPLREVLRKHRNVRVELGGRASAFDLEARTVTAARPVGAPLVDPV